MPGPPHPAAAVAPSLDVTRDVQLLRVVRQLLVDAEHRAAAADPMSRMAAVVVVGSAIETLLRAVYERLSDDPEPDASARKVERDVATLLVARGLQRSASVKAILRARHGIAHDGAVPSTEDTRRHVTDARAFAVAVVRATWAVDLERLTAVDLVQDDFLRLLLVWSRALLDDPAFEFEDTEGHKWPGRHADRRALAVGFAVEAVVTATSWVRWPGLHAAPERFRSREEDRKTERLVEFLRQREDALRRDVLAFVLGVGQAEVERFLAVPVLRPGFDGLGALHPTGTGQSPDEQDARFVVDFATDWILRAQPHLRAPTQRHPLVEYTEKLAGGAIGVDRRR